MKEISIFIDESGDFGEYAVHSPFYIGKKHVDDPFYTK